MREQESGFDKSKDASLVKLKVEINPRRCYKLELISYDGGEPKLEVEPWYVGADGKWRYDKPKKRLPWIVVAAIVNNAGDFDRAYEKWKKTGKPVSGQAGKGGHEKPPF